MNWEHRIASVKSKEDLADFVSFLREDLHTHPEEWENASLDCFLEAMAAWIPAMDQVYKNKGKAPIDNPTWSTLAEILVAASQYE
jgi:hypothetical protein